MPKLALAIRISRRLMLRGTEGNLGPKQ